jgi:hypothetical protein
LAKRRRAVKRAVGRWSAQPGWDGRTFNRCASRQAFGVAASLVRRAARIIERYAGPAAVLLLLAAHYLVTERSPFRCRSAWRPARRLRSVALSSTIIASGKPGAAAFRIARMPGQHVEGMRRRAPHSGLMQTLGPLAGVLVTAAGSACHRAERYSRGIVDGQGC